MPNITGIKIRRLREDLGITQEELAGSVGRSHEFISLLELGKRDPSLESLSEIARFFGRDMSYFISKQGNEFDMLMRAENQHDHFKKSIRPFKKYCESYLRLEKLTDQSLSLAPLYTNVTAGRMAVEERRRLGLGEHPCLDIFALFENNGLRIFKDPIPLNLNIAGIFLFLEKEQAAFALINNLYSEDQQTLAVVHLYGHYLKDRHDGPVIDNPDIFLLEYSSLYPGREQFAQTFASHFMMSDIKVKDILSCLVGSSRLTFADVLYIKKYFGSPLDVVLHRLLELGYLSHGEIAGHKKENSFEWEKSLYGKQGDNTEKKKEKEYSKRYGNLCYRAYERDKISRRDLLRLLGHRSDKLPF